MRNGRTERQPSHRNVIVSDGLVHLWGAIESEEKRRTTLIAAESVPGVRRVENHPEYPFIIPALSRGKHAGAQLAVAALRV
ncbi:BON domain-containing protein [Paraburkholderia sp.]|uniref:BON domain-containing protein n=1 Tax=Paraburkholderia sp. TaxID=1926495 RepID=UPI0025CD6B51|nr:BON domain-containing protein [Paraburkholderia sp.]